MPDAVLDPEVLADALVGVVDDIRREIHGALGTRPYITTVVTRRWSGQRVGDGTPTDSFMVLDPPPCVDRSGGDRLGPAGRESIDTVTLTGVSLRYTEAELMPAVSPGMEVVFMLESASGGRLKQEFFTIDSDPIPRRGDRAGDGSDWKIKLREVQGFGFANGTNA